MTDFELLDSSVWLDYFHNQGYKEIIESDKIILTSSLSLFEIKKKLIGDKEKIEKIKKSLDFIKIRSIIKDLNSDIAEKAAEISSEKKLPSADSIIYTTALLNNAILITFDNDFRNLNNARVLER